ncbi:Patatin-like serine hydrolase [Metarhizium album ARSEF 1941]|uniref:Patatin-like serine hydrolase n=1 Tax=Metarhizium album (strain ARSEF 1941) TaxID=1081103 RepID=A0A0B2WP04_METAS|nr:Patatin-like serine hydrolase [Metarhizium album ARSEF 1941]KHN95217.1 Patatin-like serine hydrolase [Metarhizium album ARSEF 1941]
MDACGVRRKDTSKGPPLRVLSLDGGGVRGYSMLIIVQELMHRTFVEIEGRAPRRHEIPKPCDHFDLIVGTGTGGLIALMLGRLRLDLETCKELYVRMTRVVFETDKTIAGIPYRSTLFKASKLEEAIQQAVQEHTIYEREGNDGQEAPDLVSPLNAALYSSAAPRRNLSNASTVSFSARSPSSQMASRPAFNSRYGNPHARLYDARETRTKTAVTAVYQGSPRNAPPAMLRSYDSRREPPPEFDCKIWQAGRATSAIGLAFKPVRIGQSIFHDDGAGTFNPAPDALDEAVVNEWPGREVGVFVSVGTGRRPKSSDSNQTLWYEGFLGEFAEARRRLISKIEGCEKIHEYMVREHLAKRGVNVENYYRLNVEVGVGEFGMNEWHRLGDISISTRRYMAREAEQKMIHSITSKLAKIFKAKIRWERAQQGIPEIVKSTSAINFDMPLAIELPGDEPAAPLSPPSRSSFDSVPDSLQVGSNQLGSPRSSHDRVHPSTGSTRPGQASPIPDDPDRLVLSSPSPIQYQNASDSDKIVILSPDEHARLLPQQFTVPLTRIEPPPLPPKTPLPGSNRHHPPQPPIARISSASIPPYPVDDDEPPPPVNMARKPEYRSR